jgi:archaellum component FlaC
MDIDFDQFKKDFANFEKVWKEAHSTNNKPKQVAVLNALVSNLEASSESLRDMSRRMSKAVVEEIKEEIRK